MAEDDQDLELDVDEDSESSGGGGKMKLIIIIAAVLLVGGGAAAFFLLGGEPEEATEESSEVAEPVKAPPIYVGVPNALTANLPGKRKNRTVQIKMSFVVRSTEAKDLVKKHMPQLKNDVLMLMGQKTADELKLPDGRTKLQQEALETVQKSLSEIAGEPTIEKVLFVSFVMQ